MKTQDVHFRVSPEEMDQINKINNKSKFFRELIPQAPDEEIRLGESSYWPHCEPEGSTDNVVLKWKSLFKGSSYFEFKGHQLFWWATWPTKEIYDLQGKMDIKLTNAVLVSLSDHGTDHTNREWFVWKFKNGNIGLKAIIWLLTK